MKIKTIRIFLAGDPDDGIPDHELVAELAEGEDAQAAALLLNIEVYAMRKAAWQSARARDAMEEGIGESADLKDLEIKIKTHPDPAAFQRMEYEALRQNHLKALKRANIAKARQIEEYGHWLVEFRSPKFTLQDDPDIYKPLKRMYP